MIVDKKIDGQLFRWAGSKRKLIPTLLKYIPPKYDRYIEPFCGSACLFFALKPSNALLSDINNELMNAYEEIKKNPSAVHAKVAEKPINKDFYNSIRSKSPTSLSNFERAVRFTYLNRNCFNGVYRTNKAGMFNVPMGKNTGILPTEERFHNCSQLLQNAQLETSDFEEILKSVKSKDFLYIDPPYAKKDSIDRGEYGIGSFKYKDRERMIRFLKDINAKGAFFLFSYAFDEDFLNDVPRNWSIKNIEVKRHIAGFSKHRKNVYEILIANYSLTSEN